MGKQFERYWPPGQESQIAAVAPQLRIRHVHVAYLAVPGAHCRLSHRNAGSDAEVVSGGAIRGEQFRVYNAAHPKDAGPEIANEATMNSPTRSDD
jgi:hypothetical protein